MTTYTEKINRRVIDLFKNIMTKISNVNDISQEGYKLSIPWMSWGNDFKSLSITNTNIESATEVCQFVIHFSLVGESSYTLTIDACTKFSINVYEASTSVINKENGKIYDEVKEIVDDMITLSNSVRHNNYIRSEANPNTERNLLTMQYDVKKFIEK